MPLLDIAIEDPATPDIIEMLEMHLKDMRATSPPESIHALDIEGLKSLNITFYTARSKGQLLGGGAIKELDVDHAEIKSMRTTNNARRKGVASSLLEYLINESINRGYKRISLETGTQPFFKPAHLLYQKFGFHKCGPFSNYQADPNSLFMEKHL